MTLNELTAYLVAYTPTLGLTEGKTLFRYKLPEALPVASSASEPIVALVPYFGSKASEQHFGDDDLWLEWPRIQVLTRGPVDDPAAGFDKATEVYKALGKVQAQALSGTTFHQITCLQPPFLLKWDENRRPIVAFNIEAEKEVSA